LYIIKESFSLGKQATDSLLDVSAGEAVEKQIKKIAESDNIDLSEIKTQKKGSAITANLIIKLNKSLSVDEATEISGNLRKKLMENMPALRYVAVQISSHDVENKYYQPSDIIPGIKTGKGFGWQRRGKFIEEILGAKGSGPGGKCICAKCGYETEHQRGVPCSTIKCSKCGSPMARG
jgi:hypothetical protein